MALRNIVLTVKNSQATATFFAEAIGMRVQHKNDNSVELSQRDGMGPPIIVMQAQSAATLSGGYSPLLNFDIDNMDSTVTKAINQGAILDGPIKYAAYGKIAALRSPDGHMIGIFEPVRDSVIED
jgi:predicted enzyme related to lactoylglutathione lyase